MTGESGWAARRPGSTTCLALLAATAVAVTGIVALGERGPNGAADSVVILDLSGTDDMTSEMIKTEPGWQIEWDASGGRFVIGVGDRSGYTLVVEEGSDGNGVVAPATRGSLRLAISAEGPWRVLVRQGSPSR